MLTNKLEADQAKLCLSDNPKQWHCIVSARLVSAHPYLNFCKHFETKMHLVDSLVQTFLNHNQSEGKMECKF